MAPKSTQVGAMFASKTVLDPPKTAQETQPKTRPKKHQKHTQHKPVNAWNGKRVCVRPLADPEGDLQTCVCMCLYESVCTTMLKIKQRSTRHARKNQSKINQKSTQNRPKIDPKSSQNRPKIVPKSVSEPTSLSKPFLDRFWLHFGANLGSA